MTRDEFLFALRDDANSIRPITLCVPSIRLKNLKPIACIITARGVVAEMMDETGGTYKAAVEKVQFCKNDEGQNE